MSYRVTILGKSYELSPRTLSIDRKIDKINEENEKPNVKRVDLVPLMYNFVSEITGAELPDIEEIDTNELEKAMTDIVLEYCKPSYKLKAEAQMANAQAVLETKTGKEAISIVKAYQK